MTDDLLVELLTEELPPRVLRALSEAFANGIAGSLRHSGFLEADGSVTAFATPRRLAVLLTRVRDRAPDTQVETRGPYVASGLDAAGKPTPALLGFMKKCGVSDVAALGRGTDKKGEHFVHRAVAAGGALDAALGPAVQDTLKKLPIPKVMRWGDLDVEFVRPAHGLVMLHGSRVVPGTVLGLSSGNTTRGHRFLAAGPLTLGSAAGYEAQLVREGHVIPRFEARRDAIRHRLEEIAAREGARLAGGDDLLDEVTALVEEPAVYVGEFEREFLEVPQECLILTMRANQKYFPLLDANGRLLARFLIVSNMTIPDAANIVRGNQRVVRPRLADARFFYEQDRRQKLEARLAELERMVYHNRLGTQRERVDRIRSLAVAIAGELGADTQAADRAALLCKCDLATGMVGEFPELQGTMGRYYARHDGESETVAAAIEQHYRPRFANDDLPEAGVPTVVALAEKLDTLAGIYGIGLVPTGDKDPFGLRRQALGALRMLCEGRLPLSLHHLLEIAVRQFADRKLTEGADAMFSFALDRLRGYLRERGYEAGTIDAVLSQNPTRIDLVVPRLDAVREFQRLPEAAALAAANKRIQNILRKSGAPADAVDASLLAEPAERELHAAISACEPGVHDLIGAHDYTGALRRLAGLREAVDRFFDGVMVNAEDPALRGNRLALLGRLSALMNRVADISRLAPG